MTSNALAFHRSGGPVRLPVLLSVPHACPVYPTALLRAARVPASALAILEDPLVGRLIQPGIDAGAAAIVAGAPRAEIDLNRSLDDLDPFMIDPPGDGRPLSRRAAAGLGLIPSRLASHGALWRRPLPAAEVQRRIDALYHPYHRAVAAELARMRAVFGIAILLDCHSMPPRSAAAPGVVLGDRHGSTCAESLVAAVETACRLHQVPPVRNDPYAGGEIVKRHGRPEAGIHALQIEIDRAAYLASDLRAPGPGFARTARLFAAIVAAVAEAALPSDLSLAAE